jgi:hypothetical protein
MFFSIKYVLLSNKNKNEKGKKLFDQLLIISQYIYKKKKNKKLSIYKYF